MWNCQLPRSGYGQVVDVESETLVFHLDEYEVDRCGGSYTNVYTKYLGYDSIKKLSHASIACIVYERKIQ